jgi:hypothetical protein
MLLLGFSTEVIAYLVARAQGNNMIVYYFYFSGLSILSGQYFNAILQDKRIAYLFNALALTPLLEYLFFDPGQFPNYSVAIVSLATMLVLLYVFHGMAVNQVSHDTYLLNGILLFYFVSGFIFFFTSRYLQELNQMDYLLKMVVIRSCTNTLCYIGYSYALWRLSKSYSLVR